MMNIYVFIFMISIGISFEANQYFYFTEYPVNQQVVENGEVILKCNVSDRNGIGFHWQLNDDIVHNTSRRFQVDSYLYIKNIDRNMDSGEFKCIATDFDTKFSLESTGGSLSINWLEDNVTVIRVNYSSSSYDVLNQYSKLILRCIAHASKEFSVEWYRNGNRIFFGDERFEMDDDNNLIIYDLNKDDIGSYNCRATIDLTEYNTYSIFSTNSFNLRLNSTLYPYLNYLTLNGSVIRAQDGDLNLRLECKYKNYERIDWYFRDANESLKSSKQYHTYSDGSLIIQNVHSSHAGFYSCVAINRGNYKTTYSLRVEVFSIDDLELYPDEPNQIYLAQLNSRFSLVCAHPTIQTKNTKLNFIKWYKGLPPPNNEEDDASLTDDGYLEIEELSYSEASNYTCVASVENIKKIKTITLFVLEKPVVVESPKDQFASNKSQGVSFDCKFGISLENRIKNFIVKELFKKLNINWYFLPTSSKFTQDVFDIDTSDETQWKLILTDSFTGRNLENGNVLMSKLAVKPVTESNIGYYFCEISISNFDKIRSKPAYLESTALSVQNQSHVINQYLSKNEKNILLNCGSSDNYNNNNKDEDFKWILSDNHTVVSFRNRLVDDKLIVKVFENKSLLILNPTIKNSGVYTCVIKTEIGESYFQYIVFINDTDTSLKTLENMSEGERTHLSIKQTIIIVIACALIYLIVAALLIFLCKKKLFKNNSGCSNANNLADSIDTTNKDAKCMNSLNNSNELTETTVMLDHQPPQLTKPTNFNQQKFQSNESSNTSHQHQAHIPSLQHQYENIDENTSNIEIKKPLNGSFQHSNKTGLNKRTREPLQISSNLTRLNNEFKAQSQTSLSTNLTLSSVTRFDANNEDYLKSLTQFIVYGKCCYGEVYIATSNLYKNNSKRNSRKTVTLKVLRNFTHEQSIIEFNRDIETYSKLKHDHIVKLIDICTDKNGQAPNILILEHSDCGDLKEYLIARSQSENLLSGFEKLHICYQISLAMQHFEEKLLVHGDLAARNCIIYLSFKNKPMLHIKVSNIGLCFDKYKNEYTYLQSITHDFFSEFSNTFPIPLRWQSPELLLESKQSIKSDVWSYGVCCWEIWKDGKLPYDGLSDNEVYEALKNCDFNQLESLADHVQCPAEMWTLMEKCWLESTEMRPNFYNCVNTLHSLISDISKN